MSHTVIVRHVKTGGHYELMAIGRMQAEKWVDRKPSIDGLMKEPPVSVLPPSVDMREVAICRSLTDGMWLVFPREEFEDGRFELVTVDGEPAGSRPLATAPTNPATELGAGRMTRDQARGQGYTGNSCTHCGSLKMQIAGHCEVCAECGTTTGCS